MYQGIPQLLLLLFLIMLMCNLMSPVKFAFLALFPSLPPSHFWVSIHSTHRR